MSITVRPLPTAFDPPSGPTTVATPSCCCCCCCLASLGAVAGFTAGAAHFEAKARGGRVAVATAVGALAIPLSITVLWVLAANSGLAAEALIPVWIGSYAVVALVALSLARVPFWQTVVTIVIVTFAGAMSVLLELPAALFTVFIIELFTPLTIWLGWRLARSLHPRPVERRQPLPGPPLPPPPGPPW